MENRPFLPGRGRRSWGDAPGAGNYGEKWHQKLDYVEQPKNPRQPKELRIVGGVYTLNQHFVRFEKKTGGFTGYYEVCPDFDPIVGEFRTGTDAVCPICRDFGDPDLPDEIRMFGSFRYYFDCFDLSAIKAGATSGVFGVVWANKYGKNDIAQISDTLDGYSVDDLVRGCSIFWYQNSKAKDAKERMSFTRGEPLEVKYSPKKNLYGLQYNGRVYTGEPTPFDEIVEVKTADKIVTDLKRVKLYDKLESFLASTNKSLSVPTTSSRRAAPPQSPQVEMPTTAAPTPRTPSDDWGDFGDASSDPVETPPAEAAPSDLGDDFDFGDDLPAADTPAPVAPAGAQVKDLDDTFFGEEEPDTPSAEAAPSDDSDFGSWDEGEEASPDTSKKTSPPDTSSIADDFGDDW